MSWKYVHYHYAKYQHITFCSFTILKKLKGLQLSKVGLSTIKHQHSDKKLIRRWDSERELSLRRHCTRTKYTDSCINSATDRFLRRRFTKFREITQCNGRYAVQGHSRSPILVPIERPYRLHDFLLVINTNLPPILHRFQVMVDYWSNFR